MKRRKAWIISLFLSALLLVACVGMWRLSEPRYRFLSGAKLVLMSMDNSGFTNQHYEAPRTAGEVNRQADSELNARNWEKMNVGHALAGPEDRIYFKRGNNRHAAMITVTGTKRGGSYIEVSEKSRPTDRISLWLFRLGRGGQ